MTNKFLISVSALVLGAAMSSAALANDTDTGALTGQVAWSDGHGTATSNVANTSTSSVTDNDTTTKSDNDITNISESNTKVVNAGNSNVVGSNNTKENTFSKTDTDVTTSNKESNNRVLSGNQLGSNNSNSVSTTKSSEDVTTKYSEDNDVFTSTKTGSTTNTTTAYVSLSYQDLSANITGNTTVFGANGVSADLHSAGTAANGLATGGLTGAQYNGFAGIQTASSNTGLTTANQAATGLGANASITFGTH